MRTKTLISAFLTVIVVLFLVHEFGQAQPLANSPALNVGVVHLGQAMQNCKATVKFKERAAAEKKQMDAEEGSLSGQIDALRNGLSALVPNSPDWLDQYKDMVQKQKKLEALKEYNPQIISMRVHQWSQKLYPEVLRITKELGAKKGLALVLGVEEPEFPMQRPEQLSAAIQTHKVLYSAGCVDLTSEVIAELDKMDSLLKQ
ncbi:MAG: OmpH family outer membrane protein [Sedimentisphaerales bacterium]|jgi:Skp family chaperone for outer membrane proteins